MSREGSESKEEEMTTKENKNSDQTKDIENPDQKTSSPSVEKQTGKPAAAKPRSSKLKISIQRLQKKQDKFRWSLVIGGCILLTILIVVIVALAVHFSTQANEGEANKQYSSQNGNEGTQSPSVVTKNPQGPYVSMTFTQVDLGRIGLECEGIHVTNWVDLHIIRHLNNKHYTVAVVTSGGTSDFPSVLVLDPQFSSQISYKDDAIAFSLFSENTYCSVFKNYSCTVRTSNEYFSDFTYLIDKQAAPVVTMTKAIVSGKPMNMMCSVATPDVNVSLKWKIRPPAIYKYFDLSGSPVNNTTKSNCTNIVSSTLQFVPQDTDNGADIRCVVERHDGSGNVLETTSSDKILLVIPSKFCNNKPQYSMHPHPFESCNLVVYCLNGPIVYSMSCPNNQCYDATKGGCIERA